MVRTASAAFAAVLCSSSLLFVPSQPVHAVAGNATSQYLTDQLAALEQQERELMEKINSISKEASATLENKQYLDSLVTTVNAKITAAEGLIEELGTQIGETEAQIAEHEKLIDETTEKIRERMRQNHEDGTANYLNVLLGSEGVGDFLSRLERINTMIEYDRNTLDQYKTEKASLEEEKANLEESKKLQESTLKNLEADRDESKRRAAEAENYFNSLQNDKAAAAAEYENAKKAEDAINAQIEAELARIAAAQAAAAAANQPPTSPVAGDFIWPLPSGGYISCNFGGIDPGGLPHYAVDCAISYGTPIYAAGDGTIVTATSHSSYGNYIIIDHGEGRSTLYAHCSSLAVSAGQTVSRGQVIGHVGSTGYSTGNHLHLEFRINGKKQNPFNYIPR